MVAHINYVLPTIRCKTLSLIISYALQNFLGALDGMYIKVDIPTSEQAKYRTHKGEVATNVLGVCDMKGDFIYVLVGWERSIANSCILRDTISRLNGLKVPKDNYLWHCM